MSQPVIVTGMHRSGTSLIASFIKAIGVDFGENLLDGDAFNVKGYFEDVDFLEFQRSVLQACCRPGDPGWTDWGWTESEWLDRGKFESYTEAARDLIASRTQHSITWGWKDPRTSLMLDFWDELLPEARYLFVYRLPWDVADSILRLHSGIFSQHPDYALKSWAFYNRHLLDFYGQHPERCILFNINAFLLQPTRLVELLESKLGLKVKTDWNDTLFKEIYEAGLFKSLDGSHPLVRLVQNITPQYVFILEELDRVADIPSNFSGQTIGDEQRTLESLLLLHYRAIAAEVSLGAVHQEKLELQGEIDKLKQEVSTIKMSKSWQLTQILGRLLKKRNTKRQSASNPS